MHHIEYIFHLRTSNDRALHDEEDGIRNFGHVWAPFGGIYGRQIYTYNYSGPRRAWRTSCLVLTNKSVGLGSISNLHIHHCVLMLGRLSQGVSSHTVMGYMLLEHAHVISTWCDSSSTGVTIE
jgi:hypothetical protein